MVGFSTTMLPSTEQQEPDESPSPSSKATSTPGPKQLGHGETMETLAQEEEDSLEDEIVHYHSKHRQSTTGLLSYVKTIISAGLLLFCLLLLMAAMWTHQTRATSEAYDWPPVVACILFGLALLWLAIIEGGLNCQVGLRPLPTHLYKETHALTYRATQVLSAGATKGNNNNLERFIVGRQYLDLTMVFTISFLATATTDVSVLGLPDIVSRIFLNTGLAMSIVTIVIGQLALQINAANCMLDYMNNYAMLFSTHLSLAVEASGICHVTYLVQRIARQRNETAEPRETTEVELESGTSSKTNDDTISTVTSGTQPLWQTCLFWLRVLMSATMLCFALTSVITATFRGHTKMFEGVPPWASMVLFVTLILLVGFMDALQIALMAVVHIPGDQLQHRPTALHNAKYVIQGKRLQSFLLGRQIGQTVVQFLLARITTLNVPLGQGQNIWGVSDTAQKLFNMGILGAIIATVLASLIWRVLASEYPLAFLNLPVARPVIFVCLWAEQTGVINIAWALAALHRKICGIRSDEYYLGDTDFFKEHRDSHGRDDLTLDDTGGSRECKALQDERNNY